MSGLCAFPPPYPQYLSPKCDRNLPVCNHCREDNETDCNYTPKKRHKVPSDHGPQANRPVMPYATKTASFLVNEHGQEEELSPSGGSPGGPSSAGVYEGEIRTEPQIRQYVPPHPPPPGGAPIGEDTPMEQDPDGSFQQTGPDGSFTWVRSVKAWENLFSGTKTTPRRAGRRA